MQLATGSKRKFNEMVKSCLMDMNGMNTRVVTIREISALQLKKCYRKGCQIFAAHIEETPKDKVSNLEDYAVLEEFEDVFKEVLGLPPKRDIYFSINLMLGVASVSKAPYRMSTP